MFTLCKVYLTFSKTLLSKWKGKETKKTFPYFQDILN